MRKKIMPLILTLVFVFSSVLTVFASPVDDVSSALQKAGIPASQTGKIVEYLQKVKITDAQSKQVIAKIDDVKAVAGDTTDLTKLSAEDKNKIKNDVVNAAKTIGITASFDKNSDGKTVLVMLDKDNNKLASVDSESANTIVKNFDDAAVTSLKNAIVESAKFSNNPDKAKFSAVDAVAMKHTATNYGNLMLIGSGLIVASFVVFLAGRKKYAM